MQKYHKYIFVASTKNGRRIVRPSLLCQTGNGPTCNFNVHDSHSNQLSPRLL